jgi:exodeoxyribonuclease VII large subunit
MFTRLVHQSPEHTVREYRLRHGALTSRLEHAVKRCVSRAEHRLNLAVRTLDTVSPLATLSRGFAVVKRTDDGTVITDADSVAVGDEIEAKLARGQLKARVIAKN